MISDPGSFLVISSTGTFSSRASISMTFGEQNPDEDEFLELYRTPFSDMLARVMRGEIEDAKTQIAVLMTMELVRSGKLDEYMEKSE